MTRDIYKSEAYFKSQILYGEERRETFIEYLKEYDTEQARQSDLYSLYEVQLEKAISLFCMGGGIDEVKREMNKSWPLFVDAMNYSVSTSLPIMQRIQFVPLKKIEILPLLVLSDCSKELASEVLGFTNSKLNYQIDKNLESVDAGFDLFTSQFARHFGFDEARVYPELCWPELYDTLYECFTAADSQRPLILQKYVDDWLKRAVKEEIYIKGAHLMPANEDFRGYWCFLAAAVAKMLSIDDSQLRSHPHYPYDLVNHVQ